MVFKGVKKIIYTLFNKLHRQAVDYEIKQNLKKLNIPSSVRVHNSEIYGNVSIGEYTYIAPWSVVSTGGK